jgi:hypothetical protein
MPTDRMVKRVRGAFNPKKEVSVMAWIEDDQGSVLLVRQAVGRRLWTLPGGKVKRNESLKLALKREVREETGLAVASLSYRSESTPYLINWLVGEPGAAGFGSKGVPVVGIKGSVAARAKGASKEATVRTVAARTIDAMCVRIVSQSDPKPDQRASTAFVGH